MDQSSWTNTPQQSNPELTNTQSNKQQDNILNIQTRKKQFRKFLFWNTIIILAIIFLNPLLLKSIGHPLQDGVDNIVYVMVWIFGYPIALVIIGTIFFILGKKEKADYYFRICVAHFFAVFITFFMVILFDVLLAIMYKFMMV